MKTLALALIYTLAAAMVASIWVAADLGDLQPIEASLMAALTIVVTVLLGALGGTAWDDLKGPK